MTLEDFVDSVLAGWVPIWWVPVKAFICKGGTWIGVQLIVMVVARARK
jgi:hypothetical protein